MQSPRLATVLAVCLLAAPPHPARAETPEEASATDDKHAHDAVKLLEGYAAYKMGHYDAARDIWQPLADAGNPNALLNLSTLFEQGQGAPADLAKSADLMRQSAEKGYAPAQLNYGMMLETGRGVSRDLDAAGDWFRKAADQGDKDAAFNLGVMLLVVGKDPAKAAARKAEARRYLAQAAEAGHPQAAALLPQTAP